MLRRRMCFKPLEDRGPLRVLFALTSMPVGGAEVLLVDILRRLDRDRLLPEVCCLKDLGDLGKVISQELPVHAGLLGHKYDLRVFPRLVRLLCNRRHDALVTVGAGDKMFWGRLAAWRAGLPVVACALHSTGWPDGVGRLNRMLTPLTDAFIAVARKHAEYLVEVEGFPVAKVRTIVNGVDIRRFRPLPESRVRIRGELGIPLQAPVCGIVAALRPEKNHALFLRTAATVHGEDDRTHFLVVGDGPERTELERLSGSLGLTGCVHFLGVRGDVPEVLSAMDVFSLTSHNEANPISILEAMACGLPVVAPRVGSIEESVQPEATGVLVEANRADQLVIAWQRLFRQPGLGRKLGAHGRRHVVEHASLDRTVAGYQDLIEEIYRRKCAGPTVRGCSPLPLAGTAR